MFSVFYSPQPSVVLLFHELNCVVWPEYITTAEPSFWRKRIPGRVQRDEMAGSLMDAGDPSVRQSNAEELTYMTAAHPSLGFSVPNS